MAVETSFSHGNVVVPEEAGGGNISSPGPLTSVDGTPWTDVLGKPFGWGKAFRGKAGSVVWFHGAIPTPVRLESAQTVLQDVFVLITTDGGVTMTDLHVWDGPSRVTAFGGLGTSGDHSQTLQPGVNAFRPTEATGGLHRMRFGLTVSMHLNFGVEGNVTFHAVGANFVHGA